MVDVICERLYENVIGVTKEFAVFFFQVTYWRGDLSRPRSLRRSCRPCSRTSKWVFSRVTSSFWRVTSLSRLCLFLFSSSRMLTFIVNGSIRTCFLVTRVEIDTLDGLPGFFDVN
jgi:hypothetical protein